MRFPNFKSVVGVDYSGAAQSGRTAWLAELTCVERLTVTQPRPSFRLASLSPLGKLAGSDEREAVNDYLADRMASQSASFWGLDFPFGLPIELRLGRWPDQLELASNYRGDAKGFGRMLVQATETRLGTKHVRRDTDRETQTPFDCYHYRIIYQTFHGMRDVLAPIAGRKETCVLPFQYAKLDARPKTVVVEACPSSTLKRLQLPHQNYKQSGGKPPDEKRKSVRRIILKRLADFVDISPHRRSVIMNNPGGDALDAVLAAVGSWQGFVRTSHRDIADHDRYPLEGRVYC